MIKIKLETPVAYANRTDVDIDSIEAWIYENPTTKEVKDLLDVAKHFRVLINKDNYYVACAYYFTHDQMVDWLRPYNKFNRNYYSTFIINLIHNKIYLGDYCPFDCIESRDMLEKVLPKMVAVGLVDSDIIINF